MKLRVERRRKTPDILYGIPLHRAQLTSSRNGGADTPRHLNDTAHDADLFTSRNGDANNIIVSDRPTKTVTSDDFESVTATPRINLASLTIPLHGLHDDSILLDDEELIRLNNVYDDEPTSPVAVTSPEPSTMTSSSRGGAPPSPPSPPSPPLHVNVAQDIENIFQMIRPPISCLAPQKVNKTQPPMERDVIIKDTTQQQSDEKRRDVIDISRYRRPTSQQPRDTYTPSNKGRTDDAGQNVSGHLTPMSQTRPRSNNDAALTPDMVTNGYHNRINVSANQRREIGQGQLLLDSIGRHSGVNCDDKRAVTMDFNAQRIASQTPPPPYSRQPLSPACVDKLQQTNYYRAAPLAAAQRNNSGIHSHDQLACRRQGVQSSAVENHQSTPQSVA